MSPEVALDLSLSRPGWEVLKHPARFKFLLTGRGWGKTELLVRACVTEALSRAGSLVWFVAPTYDQVKAIGSDKFRVLLAPLEAAGIVKTLLSVPITFRFKNGSRIELRGADKAFRLRGPSVNFMVLDEYRDFDDDAWGADIRPCLRKVEDRAIIATTPGFFRGYELFRKGQDANEWEWKSWVFPTASSPFIDRQSLEQARRDLDERTYSQEYLATWVSYKGLVAYEFRREAHVTAESVYDPALPLCVSCDFNVSPMATVLAQQHGDEIWVVDEHRSEDVGTAEHFATIMRKYWEHEGGWALFGDATGRARQRTGVPDWDAVEGIFKEAGREYEWWVPRSNPSVRDSISWLNGALRNTRGRLGLFINPACTNTLTDLETVVRDSRGGVDKRCEASGRGHWLDCLRYLTTALRK